MIGMVDINELYITPDNKKMIIDVSIKKKKYYKDVYLDEIIIDTQDTYTETGPSDEWILKRKVEGEDYIAKVAWETGKVDEYMDIICTLQHKCNCFHGCHDHCNHDCDCDHHTPHHHCNHVNYNHYHGGFGYNCYHHHCNEDCCNTCHCRTGETGFYSNPFSVKAIDLENKKAIDPEGIEFDLEEGAFYKFVIEEQETESEETEEQDNTEDASNLFIKDNGDIYMYNGKDMTLYVDTIIPIDVKHARIEIAQEDLKRPLADTMFFVYIKTKGNPTIDCPCGQDNIYTLGVCINHFTIYRRFMCLMRELLKDCEIPEYFIDLYLRWQSVKMCIETGHYTEAILYWKRFFLFKHQRPLWESPHYDKYWGEIHRNMFLPESNYDHPSYGYGGSLFSVGCKSCGR